MEFGYGIELSSQNSSQQVREPSDNDKHAKAKRIEEALGWAKTKLSGTPRNANLFTFMMACLQSGPDAEASGDGLIERHGSGQSRANNRPYGERMLGKPARSEGNLNSLLV